MTRSIHPLSLPSLTWFCLFALAGCSYFSEPPAALFLRAPASDQSNIETQERAAALVSEISASWLPVIGQQIVLPDREVLQALIDTLSTHPKRTVRRFDLGVSLATSCVIESIEEVTVRPDRMPGFVARGYCTTYMGRRLFNLSFSDETGQLFVSLGTTGGGSTFYGSVSLLRVQPLGESPYMLAVDLDVNHAAREILRTCNSLGGSVRGEIGYQWCAFPFADAGKVCSDSSECEGTCLLASGKFWQTESPASGVCQAETFGPDDCVSPVEDGKLSGMYCP